MAVPSPAPDATRDLLRSALSGGMVRVPDEIPGLDNEVREVFGIRLAAVQDGFAVAELEVAECHLNVRGTVQGGVFASLADAAAGWAADVTEGVGDYATVSLSGSLPKAGRLGDLLTARARTFHSGRRTCVNVVEVTIRRAGTEDEHPAGHFQCTQLVLA